MNAFQAMRGEGHAVRGPSITACSVPHCVKIRSCRQGNISITLYSTVIITLPTATPITQYMVRGVHVALLGYYSPVCLLCLLCLVYPVCLVSLAYPVCLFCPACLLSTVSSMSSVPVCLLCLLCLVCPMCFVCLAYPAEEVTLNNCNTEATKSHNYACAHSLKP